MVFQSSFMLTTVQPFAFASSRPSLARRRCDGRRGRGAGRARARARASGERETYLITLSNCNAATAENESLRPFPEAKGRKPVADK